MYGVSFNACHAFKMETHPYEKLSFGEFPQWEK
jgi:hypothetical protein